MRFFDFVPCSLPLKTLILLTFSCFLIRRRGRCPLFLLFRKDGIAAFSNEIRCALCLGCPLKSGQFDLAPLRHYDFRALLARQSCRFLETGSLFPPLAALRRFPLRAKCFSPRTCRGEKRLKFICAVRGAKSATLLAQILRHLSKFTSGFF